MGMAAPGRGLRRLLLVAWGAGALAGCNLLLPYGGGSARDASVDDGRGERLPGEGGTPESRPAVDHGPATLPLVTGALASSTDTPQNPPDWSDLTIPVGAPIFIHWRTLSRGLAPNPVSLYWTSDEKIFNVIALDRPDQAQGGCAVEMGATGCFKWSSPFAGPFRVRVVVRHGSGLVGAAISPPVNAPLRFLAGHTDDTIGTSAIGAVLAGAVGDFQIADVASLVVGPGGTWFFRDVRRGVLQVGPDRLVKVLVPTTGASVDGPPGTATLKEPYKIELDSSGNLLIFDHDRIRVFNFGNSRLDTLIGGGSDPSCLGGCNPRDLQIVPPTGGIGGWGARQIALIPVRDGSIYFQSGGYDGKGSTDPFLIRVYHPSPSPGSIKTISVSGTLDDSCLAAQDITKCPLDGLGVVMDSQGNPVELQVTTLHRPEEAGCAGTWCGGHVRLDLTGAAVGTAGRPSTTGNTIFRRPGADHGLYAVDRENGMVLKYDSVKNTWAQLLVSKTGNPACADGVSVGSCSLDAVDVFADPSGTVRIIDRGLMRRLEVDHLVTEAGQPITAGDGGPPLWARLSAGTSDVQRWVDGSNQQHTVVLDSYENRLREFAPAGPMKTRAGNGSLLPPVAGKPATDQGLMTAQWGQSYALVAVDSSGGIFYNRGPAVVARLDAQAGSWKDVVGGGTIQYDTASEGVPGDQIQLAKAGSTRALPSILGSSATDLLAGKWYVSSGETVGGLYYKRYDLTSSHYNQYSIAGDGLGAIDWGPTYPTNGSPAGGIDLKTGDALVRAQRLGGSWLIGLYQYNRIWEIADGSPPWINARRKLAGDLRSFVVRLDNDTIYYCATDGKLYFTPFSGTAADSKLPWPDGLGIECHGRTLLYDAGTTSLIFPFTQNGLGGVAEYRLP